MKKQNKSRTIYFPERITKVMSGVFDYPLTIIEAPMGYGKTTAVREYLYNTDSHVLWQRIYDNNTISFWNSFCRLFAELDINCSQSLIQLGFPNDSISRQEALRLIKQIEFSKRTVFVLDDYHIINGNEVDSLIHFLATEEIDNLHIILTARFIGFPSIDELILKDHLYHISKETFEFMPDEIKKYFRLCSIILKDSDADSLYSYTEGWISALYLLVLNYKESGSLISTTDIFRLLENAVYQPFSKDIKDLLLRICVFDSFTSEQALYILGDKNAQKLLVEITGKNAFINYDPRSKTYQIHNIFSSFLRGILDKQDSNYKKELFKKAGHWHMKSGEYYTAMHYYHLSGDFEHLLSALELDKANSFGFDKKDILINYFEECPEENKQNHPVALLIYAMALVIFNEMKLFEKVCSEFVRLIKSSSLDSASINRFMGEFELLSSFTRYNDIKAMSEYHKRACKLLNEPSAFLDTKDCWTFGSPSILYMFYREKGKLKQEVMDIKEAMPDYCLLTNDHGMGAEYVMEAEWHFNRGDFENAEIAAFKAFYKSSGLHEPSILVCTLFIQARLALIKGNYTVALDLFKRMHEAVEQNNMYTLIHTVDMCTGFMNAYLKNGKIPQWLSSGDYNSNRLSFQTMAFSNIIYGRVLLIKRDYLKLLGIAEQFISISSVFPNLLADIYTKIYIAAANDRIFRRIEAMEVLKQALDTAIPDEVYMPFVENCDYIKPLLEELYRQDIYRECIERILQLNVTYQEAVEQITKGYFSEPKAKLTERETEIAELAADGFSNKAIGDRLFITQNTVKTQLKSVFEKTGVNSRSLLKQYFEGKPYRDDI